MNLHTNLDLTPYLKVNGKIRGYCERCGREVGLMSLETSVHYVVQSYIMSQKYDMYKYGQKHPEFVKKINDICEKEDK